MQPPRRSISLPASIALAVLWLGAPACGGEAAPARPPHIVFLLADDLGWDDVGYHGSEIPTPAIDRLAGEGVRLEALYASPQCTPARAALLTGLYPMRLGLQSGVLRPHSKGGLPLAERTLADALLAAGYATAIAGKWHLGHAEPGYLPTRRGFEHQYGCYNGAIDYWTKERLGGYDWHRDDRVLREEGYATELIGREAVRTIRAHDPSVPLFLYVAFTAPHAPLQAPPELVERFPAIADPARRTYAAMVACLDAEVGAILAALEERGMARDTIVVFASDNGADLEFGGRNAPLRGGKTEVYEGGVRVPGIVRWPGRLAPRVVDEPCSFVDWLPTLCARAGLAEAAARSDGRDLWPAIDQGEPLGRDALLVHLDPERAAIRSGPWKLVVQGDVAAEPADLRVELYDVVRDPSETQSRAAQEGERVEGLLGRLRVLAREAVPPVTGESDKPPPEFRAPRVWGESE